MKLVMLEECNICPGRFLRLTVDNDCISPEIPSFFCERCGSKLESESDIKANSYDKVTGLPNKMSVKLRCPKWTIPKIPFTFKKRKTTIICGHTRLMVHKKFTRVGWSDWDTYSISEDKN